MAKDRIKCVLICSSAADALAVQNQLVIDLAARSVFDSVLLTDEDGLTVLCNARLNLSAEALSLYEGIIAHWTSGPLRNRILASSRVSKHICPHDEAVWYNCRTHPSAAYVEAIK